MTSHVSFFNCCGCSVTLILNYALSVGVVLIYPAAQAGYWTVKCITTEQMYIPHNIIQVACNLRSITITYYWLHAFTSISLLHHRPYVEIPSSIQLCLKTLHFSNPLMLHFCDMLWLLFLRCNGIHVVQKTLSSPNTSHISHLSTFHWLLPDGWWCYANLWKTKCYHSSEWELVCQCCQLPPH